MTAQYLRLKTAREANTDIYVENGILHEIGKLLPSKLSRNSVVVITDSNVQGLYGEAITSSLAKNNLDTNMCIIKPGERSKSLYGASKIYSHLLDVHARRRTALIAFGGGVVTDLVGFIASTYFRGIPYINIPTTLLAQVDSSVGGKVAVNTAVGKNLLGAFYHPELVYMDPLLLRSLPKREIRSGLGEVIKTAIIADANLFSFLEDNLTSVLERNVATLYELVPWVVKLKIELLDPDPYEENLNRPLNFGHTFGHAIETANRYSRLRHGEAVSVGMVLATYISIRRGIISQAVGDRIINLVFRASFPTSMKFELCADAIWESVQIIKMVRNGDLNFVLPGKKISKVLIVNDIEKTELTEAIEETRSRRANIG